MPERLKLTITETGEIDLKIDPSLSPELREQLMISTMCTIAEYVYQIDPVVMVMSDGTIIDLGLLQMGMQSAVNFIDNTLDNLDNLAESMSEAQ